MRINCVRGWVAVTEAIAIGRAGVCRSVFDPGIGPVPGNVPNCPLLIVKSSGASNWAASTEVSNRGYKCVLASPNASRCLPTSSPNCLRSRLLDLANWSASSTDGAVLTLDEALKLAKSNNRDLKQFGLDVGRQREAFGEAKTHLYPRFDTSVLAAQLLAPLDFTINKGQFGTFPGTGPIPGSNTDLHTPARPIA